MRTEKYTNQRGEGLDFSANGGIIGGSSYGEGRVCPTEPGVESLNYSLSLSPPLEKHLSAPPMDHLCIFPGGRTPLPPEICKTGVR